MTNNSSTPFLKSWDHLPAFDTARNHRTQDPSPLPALSPTTYWRKQPSSRGRSALVILQIDNPLTEGFLSQMKKTLQTLRPDQVLVYFSRKIEGPKLNDVYQKFVSRTRDSFLLYCLPRSIRIALSRSTTTGSRCFSDRRLMSKFSLGKTHAAAGP